MLKAMATAPDGRKILVIGLSFANLDKFRAEAGDTFIRINGAETGLPLDIMLISGATEADIARTLSGGIGPDTKVHVSEKLKN